MQTTHKQLFGGALIGAGIAVSAAMTTTATADFVAAEPGNFTGNYSSVYGYGSTTPYVNLRDETYDAVFPTPLSYSGMGLDMSSYAGTNLMGASLNLTDAATWDYGTFVITQQWFTVESGREITLEWDFTNADFGDAQVYMLGVGDIYTASEPSAGSVTLNLTPGNLYRFFGSVAQFGFNGNGNGFVRLINIPALCSADLSDDNAVDTIDLLQLLGAWGSCKACPEDINGDGTVDTIDLLVLLGQWGPCL